MAFGMDDLEVDDKGRFPPFKFSLRKLLDIDLLIFLSPLEDLFPLTVFSSLRFSELCDDVTKGRTCDDKGDREVELDHDEQAKETRQPFFFLWCPVISNEMSTQLTHPIYLLLSFWAQWMNGQRAKLSQKKMDNAQRYQFDDYCLKKWSRKESILVGTLGTLSHFLML